MHRQDCERKLNTDESQNDSTYTSVPFQIPDKVLKNRLQFWENLFQKYSVKHENDFEYSINELPFQIGQSFQGKARMHKPQDLIQHWVDTGEAPYKLCLKEDVNSELCESVSEHEAARGSHSLELSSNIRESNKFNNIIKNVEEANNKDISICSNATTIKCSQKKKISRSKQKECLPLPNSNVHDGETCNASDIERINEDGNIQDISIHSKQIVTDKSYIEDTIRPESVAQKLSCKSILLHSSDTNDGLKENINEDKGTDNDSLKSSEVLFDTYLNNRSRNITLETSVNKYQKNLHTIYLRRTAKQLPYNSQRLQYKDISKVTNKRKLFCGRDSPTDLVETTKRSSYILQKSCHSSLNSSSMLNGSKLGTLRQCLPMLCCNRSTDFSLHNSPISSKCGVEKDGKKTKLSHDTSDIDLKSNKLYSDLEKSTVCSVKNNFKISVIPSYKAQNDIILRKDIKTKNNITDTSLSDSNQKSPYLSSDDFNEILPIKRMLSTTDSDQSTIFIQECDVFKTIREDRQKTIKESNNGEDVLNQLFTKLPGNSTPCSYNSDLKKDGNNSAKLHEDNSEIFSKNDEMYLIPAKSKENNPLKNNLKESVNILHEEQNGISNNSLKLKDSIIETFLSDVTQKMSRHSSQNASAKEMSNVQQSTDDATAVFMKSCNGIYLYTTQLQNFNIFNDSRKSYITDNSHGVSYCPKDELSKIWTDYKSRKRKYRSNTNRRESFLISNNRLHTEMKKKSLEKINERTKSTTNNLRSNAERNAIDIKNYDYKIKYFSSSDGQLFCQRNCVIVSSSDSSDNETLPLRSTKKRNKNVQSPTTPKKITISKARVKKSTNDEDFNVNMSLNKCVMGSKQTLNNNSLTIKTKEKFNVTNGNGTKCNSNTYQLHDIHVCKNKRNEIVTDSKRIKSQMRHVHISVNNKFKKEGTVNSLDKSSFVLKRRKMLEKYDTLPSLKDLINSKKRTTD